MLADPLGVHEGALRGRPLRVSVVGAGYVGVVSAACLANLGHDVTLVEIDAARLRALRAGALPVREAGLERLSAHAVEAGRLRFTDDHAVAATGADLVMLAVGTPSRVDGRVNLEAIEAAVAATAVASPDALIVIKSTVPPGTAARMEGLAHRLGARDVRVVSNPEFLREGRAVLDFMMPDRIVIGAREAQDAELVERLYAPLTAPIHRCLPEEAELAKYVANALLAARISFMNEVSGIADEVSADITRVAAIVGADARIGPAFLNAGIGWGGSCFPKDVRGLAHLAEDLGLGAPMLRATIEANERQHARALATVLELVDGIPGARVGMLGLAFKPHTDDVRESPALWLATNLAGRGIEVRATDPWATANAAGLAPGVACVGDPMEVVAGADVTVLATEWPEYLLLDWAEVAGRMRGTVVFDARNALEPSAMRAAGLHYRSLGRAGTDAEAEPVCAC